ncbi:MAG: sugar ABC transporter permease [Anaerolineae bacterium]|nr:sugar ABC transporter permease [Anaerolineae bacterium]
MSAEENVPSLPRTSAARSVAHWRLNDAGFGFVLILPALLILLAIFVYPLLFSGYMSFHAFDLARPQDFQFVGINNFVNIMQSAEFRRALGNTVIYAGLAVPIEFVLGLILAMALTNIQRGRSLLRTLLIVPMMLAPTAMGLMWKFMYNDQLGIINYLIRNLNLADRPPLWLADPNLALYSVIIVDIWATTPLIILLMLAGLLSIPGEYYEAARIDGAGAIAIFRRVTLPLLRPVILVALLLRGMDAFRVFDVIYVMTKGGPAFRSDVLSFYAYRQAFTSRSIGDATAAAWIMTIILLIAGLLLIRAMRRQGGALE